MVGGKGMVETKWLWFLHMSILTYTLGNVLKV